MPQYPVIVVAQHEDGSREKFNLSLKAATPPAAMEEAYKQFEPRYQDREGWRLVVLVDELMATGGEDSETRDPSVTTPGEE